MSEYPFPPVILIFFIHFSLLNICTHMKNTININNCYIITYIIILLYNLYYNISNYNYLY